MYGHIRIEKIINVGLLIRCSRGSKSCVRNKSYVYQTYMTLNALNGSKTEVACVRIKQFKIVKPTQFRVEPSKNTKTHLPQRMGFLLVHNKSNYITNAISSPSINTMFYCIN